MFAGAQTLRSVTVRIQTWSVGLGGASTAVKERASEHPLFVGRTRSSAMKRILVVDDDPAIGRMVKLSLEATGAYQVFTETAGRRTMDAARECRPDLILLDIMMPDMDGGDVATALREDPDLAHIKLVFLTSLLKKSEEDKSARNVVIAKPVTTEELATIIEQELGQESSG